MALLFTACSDSDEEQNTITVSDFQTTIDEHPEQGSAIGVPTVSVNGELSFSILSQNPNGALDIDASSGELTVLNTLLFDYETSQAVTAEIEVSSVSTSEILQVTINLNDIDDIARFLTESKELYLETSFSHWIEISQEEYLALAQNLNQVSRAGVSEENYNDSNTIVVDPGEIGVSQFNSPPIPESNYVFAFKYYANTNQASNVRVKMNQIDLFNGDLYTNVGDRLPTHNIGTRYFVLKGSTYKALDNIPGNLALYSPHGTGVKVGLDGNYGDNIALVWYSDFETQNLESSTENVIVLYQGLTTPQRQWDVLNINIGD